MAVYRVRRVASAVLGILLVALCVYFFTLPPPEEREHKPLAAKPPEVSSAPAPEIVKHATEPWTGDLDGMLERRMIRVLVSYSRTFYFLDQGTQRGSIYELVKAFEQDLNKRRAKRARANKSLWINVVFIPVRRDRLLPDLIAGRGDIAAANLTITPERKKLVDFAAPWLTGVKELVVTGPAAPPLKTLDDLAGQEIYVRMSSSYYESLRRLNQSFRNTGKPEMVLVPADENLEDEDILEMVQAGLVPMAVVDNHKADFWAQILDGITVHQNLPVRTGGKIAWALRKNSPKLRKTVGDFIKDNREGTLLGNILLKRYLQDTDHVVDSVSGKELQKFQRMVRLFQNYAGRYGFDWLMIAAQAYQESRLDQSKRSHAGAVGVMQVLPSTAADPRVDIPDIYALENNIHAGTKYLRWVMDEYLDGDELGEPDDLNKTLLALAAYNAGPTRVARLRAKAARAGFDPNQWFQNVEVIAGRDIGRETVQYVSNIYKYYIAYHMIQKRARARQIAKTAWRASDGPEGQPEPALRPVSVPLDSSPVGGGAELSGPVE